MKIIYKISASSIGVRVREFGVKKETPKTYELSHRSRVRKDHIDVIREGVFYNSYVMFTEDFSESKVEKIRSYALAKVQERIDKATKEITKLNSEFTYTSLDKEEN